MYMYVHVPVISDRGECSGHFYAMCVHVPLLTSRTKGVLDGKKTKLVTSVVGSYDNARCAFLHPKKARISAFFSPPLNCANRKCVLKKFWEKR